MHYLLIYDVVDDYLTRRVPLRAMHLEHVCLAHQRGEIVMAGALTEPSDGAVLVFRGPTPEAADAFARADPYVLNGLIKNWRIRKWMTVIGDGAAIPQL